MLSMKLTELTRYDIFLTLKTLDDTERIPIFTGLNAEFGDERVVDTPIAEQAIIGLGISCCCRTPTYCRSRLWTS